MVSDTDKGPATCSVSGKMEGGGVRKSVQWAERERESQGGVWVCRQQNWIAGTIERRHLSIRRVRRAAFCPDRTPALFCDKCEIRDVTWTQRVGAAFRSQWDGMVYFFGNIMGFCNDRFTSWLDWKDLSLCVDVGIVLNMFSFSFQKETISARLRFDYESANWRQIQQINGLQWNLLTDSGIAFSLFFCLSV